MELTDIGHRIRLARQRSNLTQEELGHRLGYTAANPISKLESGHVTTIDVLILKRIAEITNTWLPYLVGDTESVHPYGFESSNDTTRLMHDLRSVQLSIEAFSAKHAIVPLLPNQLARTFAEALQWPEASVTVPAWWLSPPGDVFLLRVSDDAMAPTCVTHDVVVAHSGGAPGDGDLVVVQMGLELAVRRVQGSSDRLRLATDASDSRPLHAAFEVRGRVIGLMRHIRSPVSL